MDNGLSEYERSGVEQAISSTGAMLSCAVARLYLAESGTKTWDYTGILGAAVIVEEGPSFYLRILDLGSYNISYEQEFYVNFLYAAPKPFFHVFEADDSVAGLSFADSSEAYHFFNTVTSAKKSVLQNFERQAKEEEERQQEQERSYNQSYNQPPPIESNGFSNSYSQPITPQLNRTFSGGALQTSSSYPVPTTSSSPSPYPPQSYSSSPSNYPRNPAVSPPIPTSSSSTSLRSSNSDLSRSTSTGSLRNESDKDRKKREAKEERERKEQQKRDERLKKLQQKEDQKRKPMSIAGPTGVQHVSHMGWDAVNGFQLKNIPLEWRKLFKDAGIRKSELSNPETAQFIMSTVNRAISSGASAPTVATAFGISAPPSNNSYSSSPTSSGGYSPTISGPVISGPSISGPIPSRAMRAPGPQRRGGLNPARGRVPPAPPQNLANGRTPPPPPQNQFDPSPSQGQYNQPTFNGFSSGNQYQTNGGQYQTNNMQYQTNGGQYNTNSKQFNGNGSGQYNTNGSNQYQTSTKFNTNGGNQYNTNQYNTSPRKVTGFQPQPQYEEEDIPPPPPMMDDGGGYDEDIPPPPPMMDDDAPPPPSSNPLLAQIQKSKQLKPVVHEARDPPPQTNGDGRSLLETLSAAMAQRRVELKEDEDGDDGWSDEDWS